ncbi:MAG: hypothetical protein ACFFE4_13825 [Candidatus Thorarchaeota archaeon]
MATQNFLMLKFKINDYLELRLENGKTNIYVDNELFIHCKYLLIEVYGRNYEKIREIQSIDKAIVSLDRSFENFIEESSFITPEVQFWAHCSNLQVWYENNYNSSLIHSNLSFPLLRKLAKKGDVLANRVFKEQIAKKFESGYINTVRFLLYNGYLNYLEPEELDCVFNTSTLKIINNIIEELRGLMISPLDHYNKIHELLDLVFFIDLNYNQYLIIEIIQRVPLAWQFKFIRSTILHLNYKEFRDYKLPYGKFYLYFESVINYLYNNYPHFSKLLKSLETGFYNSPLSIEEKYSYGTILYE